MNTEALLDRLVQQGLPEAEARGPGTTRAILAGPVEVAVAEQAGDGFLRARWKERVRNTPQSYLLLADDPDEPGRVRALGPADSSGAVHVVRARLLEASLKRAAGQAEPLAAIRTLTDELVRIGGEGLTCRGLLTRHTLEHRLRGDASRWSVACERSRGVRPDSGWRQVLEGLGLAIERLPIRGYLARHEGRPVAVVHPKQRVRDLARVDSDGHLPEGLLLRDCAARGAPWGILVADGRFRLFDAGSTAAASEWIELDLRLLEEDRMPFVTLLGPEYLARDGELERLRVEAARFGSALHERRF